MINLFSRFVSRRHFFYIWVAITALLVVSLLQPYTPDSPFVHPLPAKQKELTVSDLPDYDLIRTKLEEPEFCSDRYGQRYVENLGKTRTSYCNESLSALTCFHSKTTSDRTDTMCIGGPAAFRPGDHKFLLDCKLRQLDRSEIAAGVPAFNNFKGYWYDTGPPKVLEKAVELVQENNNANVAPRTASSNYTILVKREGAGNPWHCLMEILSLSLTLDTLQTTIDPQTKRPYLSQADAEHTQVAILDDMIDGPYIELWNLFAKKPINRLDKMEDVDRFKNIIIPLAGGSNPLWQGDWEAFPCEDSLLLQGFTTRVLNHYNIRTLDRSGDLVVTFINRTEGRRLMNQDILLDEIRATMPYVKLQVIDFAAISFTEQIQIVRDTDILLGVHGAGLTHAMWLRPRSAVAEIMPSGINHKGFRNVINMLGSQYFSTHSVTAPAPSRIKKRDSWHFDDVYIDQDRFIALVHSAVASMLNKGSRSFDII